MTTAGGASFVPDLRAGRERLDYADFIVRYAPDAQNGVRSNVWQHFLKATEKLRNTVPIAAAWIGGSYTTGKPDPSDLDVVYIISSDDYARLTDEQKVRVAVYAESGALLNRGILVDSHVMHWEVFPELDHENPAQFDYLKRRGYWDDFLQRHTTDKFAPLTKESAVPRRGFLEVILDGYNV